MGGVRLFPNTASFVKSGMLPNAHFMTLFGNSYSAGTIQCSQEPIETSKQPIRTRCLGHVTGYQPIRDQFFPVSECITNSHEKSPSMDDLYNVNEFLLSLNYDAPTLVREKGTTPFKLNDSNNLISPSDSVKDSLLLESSTCTIIPESTSCNTISEDLYDVNEFLLSLNYDPPTLARRSKQPDFDTFSIYSEFKRRDSRCSLLPRPHDNNEKLTLFEFLSGSSDLLFDDITFASSSRDDISRDDDISVSTTEDDRFSSHDCCRKTDDSGYNGLAEEEDEMLSLGDFLSETYYSPPSSTRTSSAGSIQGPGSVTGSETSSVMSDSRGKRKVGQKKGRMKSSRNQLETIKSPSLGSEGSFTLMEILSDPDLTKPSTPGLIEQLLRPLRSGNRSTRSVGRSSTTSTKSSLCGSEVSLTIPEGEEEDSVSCTLMEFLLEMPEPPARPKLSQSTSLLSLSMLQPVHPVAGMRPKACSTDGLAIVRENYTWDEFLNDPAMLPPPILKMKENGGLLFNLTKSFKNRQLRKDFSYSESYLRNLRLVFLRETTWARASKLIYLIGFWTNIPFLFQPSIVDDLPGGEMHNPNKEGSLRKQGNSRIRDWKTRYCAVKDGKFCYYEDKTAFHYASPINEIYCGTLKAKVSDRSKFKFEVIVPNRTYYFIAETEIEMMEWIEALNKAVADALTDLKSSASSAKELIQRIYEEPSNAFCADCRDPEPKWASINLGIVVCINCSGSHRDLGVHVSKKFIIQSDPDLGTPSGERLLSTKSGSNKVNFLYRGKEILSINRGVPKSGVHKSGSDFPYKTAYQFGSLVERRLSIINQPTNNTIYLLQVRSLELDVKAWTDDMVSVFHQIGNKRANQYFEKHLNEDVDPRPPPNGNVKAFIDAKYRNGGKWTNRISGSPAQLNSQLMEVVQTDELHRTLALLMSGADVKMVDPCQDNSRKTPYLMALASGQKAQAQLLLLNDADPVLPETTMEINHPGMNEIVDLEGMLEKKGPKTFHAYNKRRCILSGKKLRYYEESNDGSNLKKEIDLCSMIDVQLANTENPEGKEDGYHYMLIRTRSESKDPRTYTFRDRDKEYLSEWCDAIKSTQVFGVSIEKQAKTSSGVPVLIHKCVIYLEDKVDQEGIYRISGVKSRYENLKLKCNQNIHDVVFDDENISINDVASLLKLFFRELPVSLLAPWYLQLTNAMEIEDETEKLYQIQDIIYELPGTEFHTLKFLIDHLFKVAQHQETNRMTPENLGVVFGPTLMSTRDPNNEYSRNEYQLVKTLIDYFPWFYHVDVDEEAIKREELRQAEEELKKIMSNIAAPEGSSQTSWIVEVSYMRESVNIRIDAGQTLRDVSAEILQRTKLGDGDYALYEFLCDGALKRPVHLSEYLLNTTVTLWDERVQRKILVSDWLITSSDWLFTCVGRFLATWFRTLHVYEGRKKWREVGVKVSQETLSYDNSRLRGRCSVNLTQITWYLGCESGISPPSEYCFTLRSTDQTKDEQFKVFSASEEQDLWRWLWRINAVKHQELDYRLVKSKRAVLTSTSSHRSTVKSHTFWHIYVRARADFGHNSAISCPNCFILGSLERGNRVLSIHPKAQCPLSNEPKMKQFGQEMAELWPKSARARTYMCQKVCDFTAYQSLLPTTNLSNSDPVHSHFKMVLRFLNPTIVYLAVFEGSYLDFRGLSSNRLTLGCFQKVTSQIFEDKDLKPVAFESSYLSLSNDTKTISRGIPSRPFIKGPVAYANFFILSPAPSPAPCPVITMVKEGIKIFLRAKPTKARTGVCETAAESATKGYNATIFAYGQTGSGKTFTITGGAERYRDRGMIPRSISYVFQTFEKNPSCMYTMHISYLEIYNENGYDLLDPAKEVTRLEDLPRVYLQEDSEGNFHTRNLTVHQANTEEDALNLLFMGDTNRMTAETPMNMASTRSHCIFTIYISCKSQESPTIRRGKIHLVDLAGCREKVNKYIEALDPEERLNVDADFRKIHFCFQYFKHLLKQNSGARSSHPSEAGSEPVSTQLVCTEKETKRLKDLVTQRDTEINILVNLLKKERMNTEGDRAISTEGPGVELLPKPANHARQVKHLSKGRQEAFDIFRRDYAHNTAIEQNKAELKARMKEAKHIGGLVNKSREKISKTNKRKFLKLGCMAAPYPIWYSALRWGRSRQTEARLQAEVCKIAGAKDRDRAPPAPARTAAGFSSVSWVSGRALDNEVTPCNRARRSPGECEVSSIPSRAPSTLQGKGSDPDLAGYSGNGFCPVYLYQWPVNRGPTVTKNVLYQGTLNSLSACKGGLKLETLKLSDSTACCAGWGGSNLFFCIFLYFFVWTIHKNTQNSCFFPDKKYKKIQKNKNSFVKLFNILVRTFTVFRHSSPLFRVGTWLHGSLSEIEDLTYNIGCNGSKNKSQGYVLKFELNQVTRTRVPGDTCRTLALSGQCPDHAAVGFHAGQLHVFFSQRVTEEGREYSATANGVYGFLFGLAGLWGNIMSSAYINPWGIEPTKHLLPNSSQITTTFDDDRILARVQNNWLILAAIMFVLLLPGYFCIAKSKKEEEAETSSSESERKPILFEKDKDIVKGIPFVEEKIVSPIGFTLFLTTIGIGVSSMCAFDLFKDFGLKRIRDDAFLNNIGIVIPIVGAVGRIAWGIDAPKPRKQVWLCVYNCRAVNNAWNDDPSTALCEEVHGDTKHSLEVRYHPDWRVLYCRNRPKQPIRTHYLGDVTGYRPIRDHYFLIRSVNPMAKNRPIRTRYLGHLTGWQSISDQYSLIRSFVALLCFPSTLGPLFNPNGNVCTTMLYCRNRPKQPIRTHYLGDVTGYRPIRDHYFLIRSVLSASTNLKFIFSILYLQKFHLKNKTDQSELVI
eukprot:sb/3460399/